MSSRDSKFEVQYILSLLIVSIGVLRVESIRKQSLDLALIGFTFLGTLHLVVSNLSYVYKSVTRYESPLAARFSRLSRVTIVLVTVGFVGTFLHAVLSLVSEFTRKNDILGAPAWWGLIDLGGPLLVVCVMSVTLFGWLRNTLGFSRDISIRTSPDTLRVYDDFDETEPVLVEIENDGNTTYEFDVQVTLPPGTVVETGDETEGDTFTLATQVEGGHRWSESFELMQFGETTEPGLLRIEVRHPSGVYSQEIRCIPR